jgi:hypothetical protein
MLLMEAIKIAILKEHLPYEIDMLDAATGYMESDESSKGLQPADRAIRNAVIEAFWVHARNLVEFFRRPKSKSVDAMAYEASAKDFAEKFHTKLKAKAVIDKINTQITHLGFGRISSEEKLGGIDANWLKHAIDTEIKRFEQLLNPECRSYWVTRPPTRFAFIQNATCTGIVVDTSVVELKGGGRK